MVSGRLKNSGLPAILNFPPLPRYFARSATLLSLALCASACGTAITQVLFTFAGLSHVTPFLLSSCRARP